MHHLVFLKILNMKHVNFANNVIGWVGSDDEINLLGMSEPVFQLYTDYLSSIGLIMKLNYFEIEDGNLMMQEHYVISEYGKSLLQYLSSVME